MQGLSGSIFSGVAYGTGLKTQAHTHTHTHTFAGKLCNDVFYVDEPLGGSHKQPHTYKSLSSYGLGRCVV